VGVDSIIAALARSCVAHGASLGQSWTPKDNKQDVTTKKKKTKNKNMLTLLSVFTEGGY
jgi:hypothetical protein